MDPTFYASYYRHESQHWWFRWRFELITRLVASLRRGQTFRILDAGCGTGQMLKHLETLGQAVGIDSSGQAIEYAASRGVEHLVHGSITAPPFPPATFDCVVALDVIEHVDDDVGLLASLRETVKPGGHLVVTVPAFQALWSEHDEINHHKRRYRAPQLRRLIEEAGFDVDRVSYCNTVFFLPVLVLRKMKNLFRGWRREGAREPRPLQSDLDEYPHVINEALLWVLRAESRLMNAISFPFGVSILAVASRPAEPVLERALAGTGTSTGAPAQVTLEGPIRATGYPTPAHRPAAPSPVVATAERPRQTLPDA